MSHSHIGDGKCQPAKYWWLMFAAVMALTTAARLMIACSYELFPDEMLYTWLSHAAPFNFCPHPPGASLMAHAGMAILGKSEIGARISPVLVATLVPVPVYLLARDAGGARVAFWSALTAAVIPIYFAFGAILTPDGAQLFMWSFLLWFTYRALETDRISWWLLSGLALGIALFIKYIVILYYPSLLLCMLLYPGWRVRLRSPRLYLSIALTVAIFLPVAIWADYTSGWSALRYHLGSRQRLTHFSLLNVGIYQGFHFLYISPVLYVLAILGVVWSGWKGVRENDGTLIFLFSFSAVIFVFFLIISAFTRRYLSREQWDAAAYVPALIAVMLMVRDYLRTADSPARRRTLLWGGATAYALCFIIIGCFLTEAATGWISCLLGENPGIETQIGWRAMSKAVDDQLKDLPQDKPGYLLANNFSVALAYAFYGGTRAHYYTLDHKDNITYGLTDLLRRGGAGQSSLAREIGNHAVFVVEDLDKQGDEGEKRMPKLKRMFAAVDKLPTLEVRPYGLVAKRFHMLRCLNMEYEPGMRPAK